MINRLLASGDRESVQSLCRRTAEHDLILLANLGHLSGSQEMVQYWGQFNASGQLVGVLMRYHVLWYLHADPGSDVAAFAQLIEEQRQPRVILNGSRESVAAVSALLTDYQVKLSLPARLRSFPAGGRSEAADALGIPPTVRQATSDDVERLAQFYVSAPEDVRRGPDSLRRSVTGGRRTFLMEKGGVITACALTTAELPDLAMMGGLHAEGMAKGLHLAATVRGLAHALRMEGKAVCVVTREPWIDELLDPLGFADIGPWQIIHLGRTDGGVCI